MKKISATFGLCVFCLTLLMTAPAGAIVPTQEQYDAQPPLLLNAQLPAVLLLISKDQKMFMQAYSDTVDADGDGHIDIGFNPAIIYTGYFDPYSCYTGTSGTTTIGFVRNGPAVAQPIPPTPPSPKLTAPKSVTGICTGATNWSGNWLNWFSTARIDAVRHVLYGGKRYRDTATTPTVLEASYIQQNSHTWGNEVWSDASWVDRASSSPYYDITQYAGVSAKPNGKDRAHFFARSDIKLHVGLNVNTMPTTTTNPEGRRIWDWATPESNSGGTPNDSTGGVTGRISYNLRVEVCNPKGCNPSVEGDCKAGVNYEAEDYCRQYNNMFRPAGLLQKYSEDGRAMFGLISGMFDNRTRWDGGALRQNVQYLMPSDTSQQQINLNDGTFKAGSLMKIIDSFALYTFKTNGSWDYPAEHVFGNPMGEMVYQAMLYFGGSGVFPDYSSVSEQNTALTRVSWDSPLGKTGNECLGPVVMIISDTTPSHDMDMLPGTPHAMRNGATYNASTKALTKDLYYNTVLDQTFDMSKFLQLVTNQEGYNQNGRTFYVANTNKGLTAGSDTTRAGVPGSQHVVGAGDENVCTAKSITNLALVRGMCPSEPQNYGGYSMVAAAYYGNTHKIFGDYNVQTYAVAMASPFPELDISVDGKGTISFMPMAMSASSANGTSNSNAAVTTAITTNAINTYIMEWKTDAKGQPYRGSFFINFDDHLEGTGDYVDYDQDAPSRYYFNLIRPCQAGECSSNGKLPDATLRDLMGTGTQIDGEQRAANAPDGANQTCGTSPCAYRTSEYVYRNWDYNRSPNYVKSNIGTGFSGSPLSPPDYSGSGKPRPVYPYGYGEVVDIYGHIGAPGTIYKKISDPSEIKDAIGMSLFVYTLGGTNNSYPAQVGYTISGTDKADGGYLEIVSDTTSIGNVANAPMGHKFNSPPTCVRTGSSVYPSNLDQAKPFTWTDNQAAYKRTLTMGGKTWTNVPGCGSPRLPLTATRLFRFNTDKNVKTAESLPNPMWLAAKYGGFNDYNRDGYPGIKDKPDSADGNREWQGEDGQPKTYFYAANLNQLKGQLDMAFTRIVSSMSTGTPTAASLNSVLGGGIAIRTYYYGEYKPTPNSPATDTINWAGGAYSLFVDPWGNLREDSNHNGKLDLACGAAGETNRGDSAESGGGDWIVTLVTGSDRPRADLIRDPDGNNGRDATDEMKGVALEDVRVLWDLSRNLAVDPLATETITTPRETYATPAQYPAKRRIYYYYDQAGSKPGPLGDKDLFKPDRNILLQDILLQESPEASEKLIKYIMGLDQPGFRNRTTVSPWDGSRVTWRLGDVINSQPVIVGSAFSNYDYFYRDRSFAEFKVKYATRRQVAYMGANDGMLHAINVGFFGSLADGRSSYQAVPIKSTDSPTKHHQLGQELWAFIPQAVLPHLQWLASEQYGHSYYLDMRPTVVEMKLKKGTDSEWRTVLITGLRLGGRSIELKPTVAGQPPTYSHSEVFALDITDPEEEPILLWRFSVPELGMVVSRPSVVNNNGQWYVILASGPTYNNPDGSTCVDGPLAYEGLSNQKARLFVLDATTGTQQTEVGGGKGYLEVPDGYENSFFADAFTLAAPTMTVKNPGSKTAETTWTNPLAYFSLTQSVPDNEMLSTSPPVKGYIDRGGVWRLQMAESDGTAWPLKDWKLDLFYDADRPITGAVNATYDPSGNLWVTFGTGRLWSNQDSRPCLSATTAMDAKLCAMNHLNYIYGLKEPMNALGQPTFTQVNTGKIKDVSNVLVYPPTNPLYPDDGRIAAQEKDGGVDKTGYNPSDGADPDKRLGMYSQLLAYLAGPESSGYRRALTADMLLNKYVDLDDLAKPAANMGTTWWQDITFEMSFYQAALDPLPNGGSNMAITTYQPTEKLCGATGFSYLYVLDTYTGLPRPTLGTYGHNRDWGVTKDDDAVSDHVTASKGKASAPTVIRAGTVGNMTVIYQNNSEGLPDDSGLLTSEVWRPDNSNLTDGIISWREVLDLGLRFATQDEKP